MPERVEAEQRKLEKMGVGMLAHHGGGAGILIRGAAEVGVAARPFAVYHMEAIQPYL